MMTTEGMKKRNDILKIWTLIATNLHFSSPQDAKSHGQSWKYAGAYGVGAGLFGGVYAAAPGAVVANIAHAAPTVAALPAAAYAAAPAIAAPLAAPAIAATYAAAPLAAAAPSREAVLTTVKLNPGHAISYRVD